MKDFIRCELCQAEIQGEKCAFAVHRKVIGGKEYYFCCENHAKRFEGKMAEK
ncbi:MAG: hypothetical protein ACUVQM_01680 [Candidatus Hadarchaeaceae archaeon]